LAQFLLLQDRRHQFGAIFAIAGQKAPIWRNFCYCRTEGTNLAQFLLLSILEGILNLIHVAGTLLVFDLPLGASETLLCCMLDLQKLPSARYVTAANSGCRDIRACSRQLITLSHSWYHFQFDVIRCLNKVFQYLCVRFVCVSFMCHVYCALLSLSVCCAVSFIGYLAFDSALQ